MNTHSIIFCCVMLLAFEALAGSLEFSRTDKLTCRTQAGNKVIFYNKYEWQPLAKIIPHASGRLNDEGVKGYYYEVKNKQRIDLFGSFGVQDLKDGKVKENLCAQVFELNDVVYIFDVFRTRGQDFSTLPLPESFSSAELKKTSLKTSSLFLARVASGIIFSDSKLIVEKVLYREGEERFVKGKEVNPVAAVLRIVSKDNGKTWSAPVIANDSKLFQIGKPISEQANLAKPQ